MAYETGASTGPNDLLDKLRLFALAQGWTVNRWVTSGAGRELCVSKAGAFYNMRSYQNESVTIPPYGAATLRYGIGLSGSDGYSAGSTWDRQPGYPLRPVAPSAIDHSFMYLPFVLGFGPFPAYYLFAPDDKTIYLEVEVATGRFQRMGFGSLDLFNASAPGGGRFFYSTCSYATLTNSEATNTWLGSDIDNSVSMEEVPFRSADISLPSNACGSAVRAAFGIFDNWCGSARLASNTNLTQMCQGGGVHDKTLREASPNSLNGIGILTPNIVAVQQGEYLAPVGVVPGMRYMDMTNYLPGDEFSLGLDVYKVFPWFQKNGRSNQRGIAYKKVT